MKQFVILGVFLSLMLSSFASAETITTILNISTASDYVTIAAEDGSTSYNCNVTSSNSRAISLQRNITTPELMAAQKSLSDCQGTLSNLTATMQGLSDAFKDSKAYGSLYAQCFSNLTGCNKDVEDWKGKAGGKEVSDANLKSCQDSLSQLNSQLLQRQRDYNDCSISLQQSKDDADQKGQRLFWGIGIGALAVYAYCRYKNKDHTTKEPE
ncbi:MAG: hypothetical protein HY376_03065 [Candidatus Blackburnbacteria bacterium]|nr:hypothetical protein [Candidatus Blackburnbacteria bacterium]